MSKIIKNIKTLALKKKIIIVKNIPIKGWVSTLAFSLYGENSVHTRYLRQPVAMKGPVTKSA